MNVDFADCRLFLTDIFDALLFLYTCDVPYQILDWFVQITLGLKHMHDRHVLHRDLKPANLLLDTSNTLRITDFGLSKSVGTGHSEAYSVVGTHPYTAPEVLLLNSGEQQNLLLVSCR